MDIYGSKRLTNESFEEYKARLKEEKKFFKQRSKGVLAWSGNTYNKDINGDIHVTINND
jgi:hypothetical protein